MAGAVAARLARDVQGTGPALDTDHPHRRTAAKGVGGYGRDDAGAGALLPSASDAPGCRRLRCPAALARRVCRLERNWWLNGWMKRCSSARLQTLAARFRSFQ